MRNFESKEISEKSATSKKSKQILGGCNMGTSAAGEIEEIRNRFSKRKFEKFLSQIISFKLVDFKKKSLNFNDTS